MLPKPERNEEMHAISNFNKMVKPLPEVCVCGGGGAHAKFTHHRICLHWDSLCIFIFTFFLKEYSRPACVMMKSTEIIT